MHCCTHDLVGAGYGCVGNNPKQNTPVLTVHLEHPREKRPVTSFVQHSLPHPIRDLHNQQRKIHYYSSTTDKEHTLLQQYNIHGCRCCGGL